MGALFYVVAALALIALLQFSLWITTKRRLESLISSQDRRLEDVSTRHNDLSNAIGVLTQEVADLQSSVPKLQPPGQSMNLSRRSQVLRMYYRGDSPSRIASVLQVSKGEVDLLLKVHRAAVPSLTWSTPGISIPGKAPASPVDPVGTTSESGSASAAAKQATVSASRANSRAALETDEHPQW